MKKQILAAAVAGAFAVPALAAADSSVTLFGTMQTQVVYHDAEDLTGDDAGFRMHDAGGVGDPGDGANPNRIGVRVAHDLGGGLTGLAKIEQNVTSTRGFDSGVDEDDDGELSLGSGARDVYVGLDTDFGTFLAGRMATPFNTAGKDPLNATFMQARNNWGRTSPLGGLGNGSYVDRALAYGNDFGPVSFLGAVVMDNEDDSNSAFSARLSFDAGPAEIYGAFTNADDHSLVFGEGDNDGDAQLMKIGVDWSDGPFRVVAEIDDVEVIEDGAAGGVDHNSYFVSGTYTMGRNDFVLNVGFTDHDNDAEDLNISAAVKHNLSNRVMAYAGLAYVDEDDGDNSEDGFAVGGGMRVSF